MPSMLLILLAALAYVVPCCVVLWLEQRIERLEKRNV